MKERIYMSTSLVKALSIIDLFSFDAPELSITEIANLLSMNASSLYPLLATLTKFRYLERNSDTKRYRLGIKFLEKGYIVQAQLDIRDRAGSYLEELRAFSRENVHLAILDGHEIVYIDRRETVPTLPIESRIGKRGPAHCTALGKALLAWTPTSRWEEAMRQKGMKSFTRNTITDIQMLKEHLTLVREQGYAVDDGEFQEEGYCIGAPIRDYRGIVVAAVSVSVSRASLTPERQGKLVEAVIRTARKISESLGFVPSEGHYREMGVRG